MPLLLLASCAYTLVDYTVPSLPDTYMTEPQARDLYCEVGYSYIAGVAGREGEYAVREVDDRAGSPAQTVYTASGVLVTWGPCR